MAAPVPQLFSYLSAEDIAAGTRVVVPFGKRQLFGVVMKRVEDCHELLTSQRNFELKSITRIIDNRPIYSEKLLSLAHWLSEYYCHPLGEVLKAMLPPSPKNQNGRFTFLDQEINVKTRFNPLDTLARRPVLNDRQQAVLQQIIEKGLSHKTSSPFLLHGVTGAGKTEVFLRAIDWLLWEGELADAHDAQVLVMVPEISLTPQMTKIFVERFGEQVAVVHSAMNDRARWLQLERIRTGSARVLVGPRSSVFAPFRNLKLIVVDEEHDSSYKQTSGFAYHGRDVAVMRGKVEGATVLLSSATPSMESLANASTGKYNYAELPDRISHHGLPEIKIIQSTGQSFKPSSLFASETEDQNPFCQEIIDELRSNFENTLQAIVLVNRRGYAHYLYAAKQDKMIECPDCSITMTLHQKKQVLRCHYCDKTMPVSSVTSMFPSENFFVIGSGSQRAEEYLKLALPDARIARLDSDSASDRNHLEEVLSSFRRQEIDILVGTQMLAKGHDFARVALVALIEVDHMLGIPDFRGGERTFQLLVQAAGRAGRAEHPGRVLIQTRRVQHPIIQFAINHDFKSFAKKELNFRASQKFPPFSRMAIVELNSSNVRVLQRYCKTLSEFIDQLSERLERSHHEFRILGPTSASIEVVRGRTRKHIILFSQQSDTLHRVLKYLQNFLDQRPSTIRVKFDIDPQSTF